MTFRHWMLCVWLATGALAASNDDVLVEATGYGPTKDAATRAAQRAAVEKGIGQILTSQTEIQDFQVRKDLILTRTEGAVRSSEVLQSILGPDSAWEVRLRAVVSKADIREDLVAMAVLRSQLDNPRVTILLDEKVLGERMIDGNAESILIQFFKDKEFEVVDPSDALRSQRAKQIALATGGDVAAAVALGQEWGAEVVVVGTAMASEADMTQNEYFKGTAMKSASGIVVLKAIDVGSREILASKRTDAPAIHPNPTVAGSQALDKATRRLLEKEGFTEQLLKSWQSQANNGTVLRIQVGGIPNYRAGQLVQEELRLEAVSVVQRKLQDSVLYLDVTWRGTAEDFCNQMDGRAINKGRNVLSVRAAEGKQVTLDVK